MDGIALGLFLAAAFLGGLTSGLSGFAMGLVVSGVWLHIIPPQQNAMLIVLYGLVTQASGLWVVRRALKWRMVAPYVIGSVTAVPAGTALLALIDPARIRLSIGAMLVIYSLYSLLRPAFKPVRSGVPVSVGVGIVNGLIGGFTGLGGIAITVWSQLLGNSKDAQRAVIQPVIFATFVMSAISLSVAGVLTIETMKLYLLGLPVLVAGIWCGIHLYGKLDDAAFRRVILGLLLAAGISLVMPALSGALLLLASG